MSAAVGPNDGAVVLALAPLTKVAVAEAVAPRRVAPRRVGEQGDDAALCLALTLGLGRSHGQGNRRSQDLRPAYQTCRSVPLPAQHDVSEDAMSEDLMPRVYRETHAMSLASAGDLFAYWINDDEEPAPDGSLAGRIRSAIDHLAIDDHGRRTASVERHCLERTEGEHGLRNFGKRHPGV